MMHNGIMYLTWTCLIFVYGLLFPFSLSVNHDTSITIVDTHT